MKILLSSLCVVIVDVAVEEIDVVAVEDNDVVAVSDAVVDAVEDADDVGVTVTTRG